MIRPLLFAALLAATANPACAQTAEERLDALDARITRLEDLNAIERLQKAYGYFVDESQWTRLSELFSEDATLEIGGKGLFLGKARVLEYMQTAFGPDGAKEGVLANHMQFKPIPDVSSDGRTGWVRSRAFVMSNAGWGGHEARQSRMAEIARHCTRVFSLPAVRAPKASPRPSRRLRSPWISSSRTMIVVTIQGASPASGTVSR